VKIPVYIAEKNKSIKFWNKWYQEKSWWHFKLYNTYEDKNTTHLAV
jgi:hypothetical protein